MVKFCLDIAAIRMLRFDWYLKLRPSWNLTQTIEKVLFVTDPTQGRVSPKSDGIRKSLNRYMRIFRYYIEYIGFLFIRGKIGRAHV